MRVIQFSERRPLLSFAHTDGYRVIKRNAMESPQFDDGFRVQYSMLLIPLCPTGIQR